MIVWCILFLILLLVEYCTLPWKVAGDVSGACGSSVVRFTTCSGTSLYVVRPEKDGFVWPSVHSNIPSELVGTLAQIVTHTKCVVGTIYVAVNSSVSTVHVRLSFYNLEQEWNPVFWSRVKTKPCLILKWDDFQ